LQNAAVANISVINVMKLLSFAMTEHYFEREKLAYKREQKQKKLKIKKTENVLLWDFRFVAS
jgi:hypothetical protein